MERRIKFFTQQAIVIQKYYRGHYSRKYEHDFFARKKYLQHVEDKNADVRKILDSHQKERLR